jgi:hypothetical protein
VPAEYSVVIFAVRAGMAALASVFAILLWPRNRDPSWVLVTLGTILLYLSLLFDLLVKMQLLVPELFVVFGFPVFDIVALVLAGAPYLFFIIAFIIMLARKY